MQRAVPRRATFDGFDPYKLTGVRVTNRKLGHGSYATVLELQYLGLKCAGKKIHEVLLEQGDASYTVRRFEGECRLLSQVHHPNIVQFLGVYFQRGVRAPILVMEFLPTNLTSCIEQYGILPKEISYSILYDVALGLCYLHSQIPPIIHRDLSSNNVLLTPNMTAKISDLGVARILNLTPLQVSRMTQTPGTPAYMPPEVMVANPRYDTSVDEFSYGIMMIHIFSGRWPEPQVGQIRIEPDGRMIPVTEAERREVFLQAIEKGHPLMAFIRKCIHNNAKARAHASEIVERLADMVLQFPASFTNRLEMLKRIEEDQHEKQVLTEEDERKDRVIRQKEGQISSLKEEILAKQEVKTSEIDRLKLAHSSEMEQLLLQFGDLNTQYQFVTAKLKAEIAELKSHAALHESQIKQLELQLAQEREMNKKMIDLKSDLSKSNYTITKLQADITKRDSVIQMNAASAERKASELEVQSRALEEKKATITAMSQQLTKAREYLATEKQVLQASVSCTECAIQLPVRLSRGKTTIINGKIYYGAGVANRDYLEYNVYCYDPLQNIWITLPPLPVRWFGLGEVNGKVVAVGGKRSNQPVNEVQTYDEQSHKWKRMIPPMPTARWSLSVLNINSALLVVGGYTPSYTAAVEIFTPDTSQWYTTEPLPTPCIDVSLVAIGNTCYALGGYKSPSVLNQALCASVDDLFGNAVPATNQTPHSGSSDTWKTLPNTPTYRPAAAVLAGNLLAVGGIETSEGGAIKKEIYMYSSSTDSWIYISDLPAPRSLAAVAALSSTEILVLGGWDGARVDTVYKGTLHVQ